MNEPPLGNRGVGGNWLAGGWKGRKMNFRLMQISDYDSIYNLWINTPGMGLNSVDDSKEGIEKFLKRNPVTCFVAEEDEKIVGVIMAGNTAGEVTFIILQFCQSSAESILQKLLSKMQWS